jgi:FAD/FMN-containing dehydrogenase
VTDGLGVGSFEYGWLRENVLSAEVVLPEGERREIRGEELGSFFETGRRSGIVVGAKLRTRRADTDVPFGLTFETRRTWPALCRMSSVPAPRSGTWLS